MTMMRVAGGALAVTLAALLVCCNADPHQEQDVSTAEHNSDRFDSGHKTDAQGSLVRQVRETHHSGLLPYMARRYDSNPYSDRQMWALSGGYGYYGEPPKRNFDEIDRSDLGFMRKRNFDEIDQTSMPFPYAKRFYHMFGPNYLDTPVSIYDKKRNRPEYPMDEIDLSQFPIGSKRSMNSFPLSPRARR
ncbi:orcokinin peptides-like isoform X3 [Leguminivora glycinivorella]|uniref:orcokinin peptides-like isoform X3 n=1 Tax=Leguminivora glycinivorella TaxID=1035111 RepID=UPI00200F00F6|nr:orcokinin peptides-like isoform X3 [Leguminivora glycinivorella]